MTHFGCNVEYVLKRIGQLAGEVDRRTVGEVTTLVQPHHKNRVPRLQDRHVGSEVGLRSTVCLDVGMLGPKQLFGPVASHIFGHIHKLTAAVITPARVAFGIFIGQN